MIPHEWVDDADKRLTGQVVVTPITYSTELGAFFKWENHQTTGSFKLRGALNKALTLQDWELAAGLVTCSAGNHGQGVALAARRIGCTCSVFASKYAAPVKLAAMKQLGAEVMLVEGGYDKAEKAAVQNAQETKRTFISPYNDGQVIAGQGTVGKEILAQVGSLQGIDAILVPVGGGGLICGIGTAFENLRKKPRLIGVQSQASSFAHQLHHFDSQTGVVETESLADGLAGMIDPNSITIPMMRNYIDEILLVSEDEIRDAIRYAWKNLGEMIEGSAAVGLAARLSGRVPDLKILNVVTGGNIQLDVFEQLTAG